MSTVRTLTKIDLDFYRDIGEFQPAEAPVKGGTMLDAIEVSLDMMDRFCGTKKFRKRLFLITDGEKDANSSRDEPRLDRLVQGMRDRDVRLNVITLDFANELGQEDSESEDEAVAETQSAFNGADKEN